MGLIHQPLVCHSVVCAARGDELVMSVLLIMYPMMSVLLFMYLMTSILLIMYLMMAIFPIMYLTWFSFFFIGLFLFHMHW